MLDTLVSCILIFAMAEPEWVGRWLARVEAGRSALAEGEKR